MCSILNYNEITPIPLADEIYYNAVLRNMEQNNCLKQRVILLEKRIYFINLKYRINSCNIQV